MDTWVGAEEDYVASARLVFSLHALGLAEPGHLLATAWERLQASGVLAARGIDEEIQVSTANKAAQLAKVYADNAARGLRRCAAAICGATEVRAGAFKHCAACKGPVYCCKEHQVADWPSHKAACKAARKAAATSGGALQSGAA